MERDKSQIVALEVTINFNSHAHVERDPQTIAQSYNHCISTHTLTWSVTKNEYYSLKKINISTHTLTWSVT